ncbi:hypothetical protein AVEN_226003-1 [Araneus ventricosus]|uniref:Uncharacterized protein n=1 Tax=Araneus ventricosus TaxID=182803 RepID=A0A4Y2S2B4_ARAVE|nr:hypothetical protein AVEN_63402-1 [Araneus ventricosus]GBN81395.1 hypothetical protein AVEN_226003-1 [Araneus ventricosus]
MTCGPRGQITNDRPWIFQCRRFKNRFVNECRGELLGRRADRDLLPMLPCVRANCNRGEMRWIRKARAKHVSSSNYRVSFRFIDVEKGGSGRYTCGGVTSLGVK